MQSQSMINLLVRFPGKKGCKSAVYLVVSVWFMLITAGCASLPKTFNHESHDIAKLDISKIYPAAISTDHHIKLTLEQSRLINKLYGEEISQKGNLLAYYSAVKRLPRHYKSKVFLVHVEEKAGRLEVLVGTRGRVVDKIVVKNNVTGQGKPVIPDEFLQQFIGRSLQDSWQVAEGPQDLLTLPSMLRPVVDQQNTSKEIASNIRKVLVWVTAMELYYS